jgi:glutamate-1-semialdehyde 2,1-aminomutase
MNILNSEQLFQQSKIYIPGGVNSPVRAFKSVGGNPIFFKGAKGSKLFDVDNNEYIDYIGSWGPMILGHAFPLVTEAITNAAQHSTSFGAPTEMELKMAELICNIVPNVEMVRMVNSGTEATMSAIRLARGYTGKEKIIKFEGCYHGHGDSFLIKAGSGAATLGEPSSKGVTQATSCDTLTATFNNINEIEHLIEINKGNIAAIIIEPVAGNMGCVPPKPNYLQAVRNICDRENIVLIFDEVMTGFRLALGGAQELYGVSADLVTMGKIIGGGLPVGAYGGKKEIMSCVAPLGGVYQAGTLSGNPIAMASGYTVLKYLSDNKNEIYSYLKSLTTYLSDGLQDVIKKTNIPYQINSVGSMISVHFCENEVIDFVSAQKGDNDIFKKYFHEMLKNGIYLPPSAYETWFVSAAHNENDILKTIEATSKALQRII